MAPPTLKHRVREPVLSPTLFFLAVGFGIGISVVFGSGIPVGSPSFLGMFRRPRKIQARRRTLSPSGNTPVWSTQEFLGGHKFSVENRSPGSPADRIVTQEHKLVT